MSPAEILMRPNRIFGLPYTGPMPAVHWHRMETSRPRIITLSQRAISNTPV